MSEPTEQQLRDFWAPAWAQSYRSTLTRRSYRAEAAWSGVQEIARHLHKQGCPLHWAVLILAGR